MSKPREISRVDDWAAYVFVKGLFSPVEFSAWLAQQALTRQFSNAIGDSPLELMLMETYPEVNFDVTSEWLFYSFKPSCVRRGDCEGTIFRMELPNWAFKFEGLISAQRRVNVSECREAILEITGTQA